MSYGNDKEKIINGDISFVHRVTLSNYYPNIYKYMGKDYKFSLTNQNIVSLNIITNLIKMNKYSVDTITEAFKHIINTPELHGNWKEV